MPTTGPSILPACAASVERAADATTFDERRSPRQPASLDDAEQISVCVVARAGSHRCPGCGISAQRSDRSGQAVRPRRGRSWMRSGVRRWSDRP